VVKQLFLSLAFIFSFLTQGNTNHIVAGFSNYKHVDESTYEVKFTLIRNQNSGGTPLDMEVVIQIYTFDGLEYIHEGNLLVERDSTYNFDHGEQNSFASSVNVELEYAEYIIEYNLEQADKDYVFVHQRCCRTNLTSNLSNPGENGITLSTTITMQAQALQNSSIEFELLPQIFRKVNQEEEIPIEVVSIDGDILSYQLSPIYLGGGPNGTMPNSGNATDCDGVLPQGPCYPPYSQASFAQPELNFFKPIPSWNNITMDGQTGNLTGAPTMSGWFSYGFTIHENRNGQIINSTNFDYLMLIGLTSSTSDVIESSIEVLGNPSSDLFYISVDNTEKHDLLVTDMNGHRVRFSEGYHGKLTELNIEGPSGVYILSVSNGKTFDTVKLVKL